MHGSLEYFQWSERINRRYCERHGYNYVIRRDQPRDDRHLHWHKIPVILDELRSCDYMLFLDADAVFYSHELTLEAELIPELKGKLILMAADCGDEAHRWNPELPNAGTILVKNDEQARNIVELWNNVTDTDEEIRFTHPCEQLGFWKHVLPKYREQVRILPDYYVCNGAYGQFIRHLLIFNEKERTDAMQAIYNRLIGTENMKSAGINTKFRRSTPMTVDDFDIIVMTVPENSERIPRLLRCFRDAGINRFMIDYAPKFTGKTPIPIYAGGSYGCAQHFCDIQSKFANRNIIFIEDDAFILPDFCETMNQHLAELPKDWKIFVAGYTCYEGSDDNVVSENIRKGGEFFWGSQCLVLRSGRWRNFLADEIRNHSFFTYRPNDGFDCVLLSWCKANDVPCYLAAQSFAGQGGFMSSIRQGCFNQLGGL